MEMQDISCLDFSTLSKELGQLRSQFESISVTKVGKTVLGIGSLLPWPVVLLSLICVFCFYARGILLDSGGDYWVGSVYLILLVVNFAISCHDAVLRKREVCKKLKWLSESIADCTADSLGLAELLKRTEAFTSPSYSFTAVTTKGRPLSKPISLPTSLVSTGDVINLCIGQSSPCQVTCAMDSCVTLAKDETLTGETMSNHPDQCDHSFRVLKSPIIENLEGYLQIEDPSLLTSSKTDDSKSMLRKRREILMYMFIFIVFPIMLICSGVVGIGWYIFRSHHTMFLTELNRTHVPVSLFAEWGVETFWFEVFLSTPALFLVPILPVACPVIWVALFAIGEAKTLSPCLGGKRTSKSKRDVLPSSATVQSISGAQSQTIYLETSVADSSWVNLLPEILFGSKKVSTRIAGAFDSLGSLTVLCCINKEGILSWINPYPEKVFFFGSAPTSSISKPFQSLKNDFTEKDEECSSDTPLNTTLDTEATIPPNSSMDAHIEVLSLSQDTQNPDKIYFDEPNWRDQISSLKAICLDILVTHPTLQISQANLPDAKDAVEQALLDDVASILQQLKGGDAKPTDQCEPQSILTNHQNEIGSIAQSKGLSEPGASTMRSGLRALTQLTGFDDEVTFLYVPKRTVTLYAKPSCKPTTSPTHSHHNAPSQESFLSYMHGVVVAKIQDQQDHLLVAGSGDMVTDQCAYFWNGTAIRPMDGGQRAKAADFYNRAAAVGHCVAFSCAPVSSEFAQKESFIAEVDGNSTSKELPSGQIFLGMVSLQYQSRLPVFHLVEALEKACIRFVHFTAEDEIRARVFAEKMGIEVGWNCHISLSSCNAHPSHGSTSYERTFTENSEDPDAEQEMELLRHQFSPSPRSESSISESAFHVLNRAKLPRGIENIAPHIENVDNVPLLVPLFTDCKKQSVCEMIGIMQKYGEVVGCIGSADSIDNFPVFAQANASVAIQPVVKPAATAVLANTSGKPIERNTSFYTRPNADSRGSRLLMGFGANESSTDAVSCSRILNTLPCSVALSGDGSLSVVFDMIKQARHFLFLVQVALIFYVKSLCCVSLALLLCHVTHLPSVFAAGDTLWLCYVILPTLSFSLLASPSDVDLMSWASLKNTRRQAMRRHLMRQNVAHFCLKFLPSCLLVLLLYAVGLSSACAQLQNEKFAAENATLSSSSANFSSTWGDLGAIECYPYFTVTQQSGSSAADLQRWTRANRRESQQIALSAFVLYTCIISIGYVHRWRLVSQRSPLVNRAWIFSIIFTIAIQASYSAAVVFGQSTTDRDFGRVNSDLSSGPYQVAVWVLMVAWCLPCFGCNELFKWREIRMWSRGQKRARLEFGTKLGMNSPF